MVLPAQLLDILGAVSRCPQAFNENGADVFGRKRCELHDLPEKRFVICNQYETSKCSGQFALPGAYTDDTHFSVQGVCTLLYVNYNFSLNYASA